ncbi:hypothetical protein DBR42_28470 [Pelomonas sp. HMWF004]|nr:hypothetical protein DBR42_28470 [Pelomonas sp. HMWF004]
MPDPFPGRMTHWACGLTGALLFGDAVVLMAGYGQFNVGVLLPFGLGACLLAMSLGRARLQAWLAAAAVRRRLWRLGWIALGCWVVSLVSFWLVLARGSHKDLASGPAPAAIVVLGSRAPNGHPSAALAARLDAALIQAGRFPQALVLVSGGVDFGERLSEAQAMGDYLRGKGLVPHRIVQEESSTSTAQNLQFSQALLAARGITADAPLLIVSSDFHTLRASWIARKTGYTDVRTVGAPTPLSIRFNAWLREYFAVISGFVLREF